MPDESAPPASAPRFTPLSAPLIAALHARYEIVRETGRGASATVYLARDLKHDRLVAVKTLNPEMGAVAGERFLREIQVSAGMQHPHILPTYDSGIADGRLYFVMPFVDGGSLRQRLDAEPQLAITDALRVAHDIAVAIAFAHEQGVVHRDIKPENILFYHGHACLADFGVARVMEQLEPRVTGVGMIVGTPAYMSPEQLQDGGFDGRSDVYSLACVLYEMIAGVHAFSGSTPQELLRQRLRRTSEPLHKHRPDAPQFVEEILTRALAPSPADRFLDARQFADALEAALLRLTAPRRIRAPLRAFEAVPRHPMLWIGALSVVLGGGALAASPLRHVVTERVARTADASTTARDAYAAGVAALKQWDLPTAMRELGRATTANPRLAAAQLELARTLQLQRSTANDGFRIVTARLATLRGQLHGRDSLYAEAAIALGEGAYERACATYDRLRMADSLDALAWYGLGDCLSLDSTVVRDRRSASGWSFRTSWPAAARAYMRAATIEPAAHRALPFTLLWGLLPVEPNHIRLGRSERNPNALFAAYASLSNDTVAYEAYPLPEFSAGRPNMPSSTLPDALERNRDQLVMFARQWVAVSKSVDAYEALSAAFEARLELGVDEEGAESALRHAAALAQSPEERVRLGSTLVRLRLKRGEFQSARELADSLLDAWGQPQPPVRIAARLAGLAALTGRVSRSAQLLAAVTTAENAGDGIAPPLTATWSQLYARAALGVCDDSLMSLRREIEALLDSYSQPVRRGGMRTTLLTRPMSLAFPCLGAVGIDGLPPISPLDRAQRAIAAHDLRRGRAILDSVAAMRRGYRPGDISLDYTVHEAWLHAALGDTVSALRSLDLVLNALPTLGTWAVREEAQAAAVGRALLLRAELADRMGDMVARRRRAREALVLWQHADPSLSTTMDRLRMLASAR